ncbi:molecular chaperone DnaJ [Candidatus Magnetomorum sp. HK-1]|nr:molecular chaperone DnaJ [Candidatus Magnetomorum sp. HK-1]
MITGFEKIVEERIQKAQKKGVFNHLPGKGFPLPHENVSGLNNDLRLAYKILKNADCLPPELELKKEIQSTEALLANMTDTQEKYKTIKKLNYLIMKLNISRNQSPDMDCPQKYYDRLVLRVEKENICD